VRVNNVRTPGPHRRPKLANPSNAVGGRDAARELEQPHAAIRKAVERMSPLELIAAKLVRVVAVKEADRDAFVREAVCLIGRVLQEEIADDENTH
jgi:hypothetical protein